MQILIHKTSLVRLKRKLRGLRIGLGDPVQLVPEGESDVVVLARLPSRLTFGLGKSRIVRLGYLSAPTKVLLMPALQKGAQLRVRIVEIESAHLRTNGADQLSISVWGTLEDLVPTVSKTTTFPQSRINGGPSNPRDEVGVT